jgi:hypothetical protein
MHVQLIYFATTAWITDTIYIVSSTVKLISQIRNSIVS